MVLVEVARDACRVPPATSRGASPPARRRPAKAARCRPNGRLGDAADLRGRKAPRRKGAAPCRSAKARPIELLSSCLRPRSHRPPAKRLVGLVEKRPPAPAGLAPAERGIDHYRPVHNRYSPFFPLFGHPAHGPGGRKEEKTAKGAGEVAFLVANPSLRWGKPSGGGTKSSTREPPGSGNRRVSLPSLAPRGKHCCFAAVGD